MRKSYLTYDAFNTILAGAFKQQTNENKQAIFVYFFEQYLRKIVLPHFVMAIKRHAS